MGSLKNWFGSLCGGHLRVTKRGVAAIQVQDGEAQPEAEVPAEATQGADLVVNQNSFFG
jgi:hypothetical protein